MSEEINVKIEGMDCANCALTIHKHFTKKGFDDVKVNFITGQLSFTAKEKIDLTTVEKDIDKLGYHVVKQTENNSVNKKWYKLSEMQRFGICVFFTLPLMLHMIPGVHIHWLMQGSVQLALTIPVFLIGMWHFGRNGIKSLVNGIPNMDVLITIGAAASFFYSLYGTLIGEAEKYLFYETTATIITLVFFGNWLEHKSFMATQQALKKITISEKLMANMIAYDDKHEENIFQVEANSLKTGDLLLIKLGEQVPADCKILWGNASVNESILTGESIPLEKTMNDHLIGGSILVEGTVKAYVTAAGETAVMSQIVKLATNAQSEKPPVQQLADKISAIFVPIVIGVAILTLALNMVFAHTTFAEGMLRAIAVLVIACPCAMGLATPAAIAVGLGRAANNGILFKNAKSLEIFKHIKQVVFDKTGTLTTGDFTITNFHFSIEEEEAKKIVYSLEKFSTHPIAKCIAKAWKTKNAINWKHFEEIKGIGICATDKEGNIWKVGSYKMVLDKTTNFQHSIYLLKNETLVGWIDVEDEIRPEAKEVIGLLKALNINTILLSGDKLEKCKQVAEKLGIVTVFAEQTPEQKYQQIAALNATLPTAMVGDGINDAAALAKSAVGISIANATQLAIQHAQVILLSNGLRNLPLALGLGKQTYITIQQNLFWAFAYNIIAIPIAAFGFLSPTIGALVMGLSDVVLAINSIRLRWKKVL